MLNLSQSLAAAMRTAGAEMLDRADFVVHSKNGSYDFVTDMDFRMQERMRTALTQILPEAAFLSEEDLTQQPAPGQYYWLIDPIDGTTNFVRDLHLSCIAVALCQDDAVVLGAVYIPWGDEFYYAERGCGAFLNDKPIHVSDRSFAQAVANFGQGYGTRQQSYDRMRPIHAKVCTECTAVRALGTAEISLCYVAAGRVDVYIEQAIGPWDHAAGSVIVQEAGGVCTNWHGTACNLTSNDSMVAGNPTCHAEMLSTTQTLA